MKLKLYIDDMAVMSQKHLSMSWDCPYSKNLRNTIWLYVSHIVNESLEVDEYNLMLCRYNNENLTVTLISTIVKSYLFACKYMAKVLDPGVLLEPNIL